MREAALPVKGLVRRGADPAKIDNLRKLGVELVEGDLKEPSSLEPACRGAKALISTASSMLSHREGDSIQTVDLDGQTHLIEAAKAAGVEHFVFISFRGNTLIQARSPRRKAPLSAA